ncbi:hypothetical protein AKJ16_DCAP01201 [Drosera capensis]
MLGGNLTLETPKSFAQAVRGDTKSPPIVHNRDVEKGMRLASEPDMMKILYRSWFVRGKLLILHKWVPGFVPDDQTLGWFVFYFMDANSAIFRFGLWEELRLLTDDIFEPWLVYGDFNSFIQYDEKVGYEGVSILPYPNLKNCISHCALADIQGMGCFHTCFNNQGEDSWMLIKQDRAMENVLWIENLEHVVAHFLEPCISDHSPIPLKLLKQSRPPTPFRIVQKLKKLRGPLKELHHAYFSALSVRSKQQEEKLLSLQQ